MSKIKVILKNISDAFNKWYKSRLVHRIFFIATLLGAVLLVVSNFDNTGIIFIVGICVIVVAIISSVIDTIMNWTEFSRTIKRLENNNKAREAQYYGQPVSASCFSPEDKRQIRKKRMTYLTVVAVKVIFALILIALILQNGV